MQYVYSSKTRALKNKKRATTKVVRSIVYDVLQTSWEILPQFSPLWLKGKEEKRPLLLWFYFKWLFKIFLSRPWQMELFSYFVPFTLSGEWWFIVSFCYWINEKLQKMGQWIRFDFDQKQRAWKIQKCIFYRFLSGFW